MGIYKDIVDKKATIAVIGLGYVGLPIALAFAKKVKVIGFDINEKRVNMMKKGVDPSNELTKKDFANSDITFTHKLEDLKKAKFLCIYLRILRILLDKLSAWWNIIAHQH